MQLQSKLVQLTNVLYYHIKYKKLTICLYSCNNCLTLFLYNLSFEKNHGHSSHMAKRPVDKIITWILTSKSTIDKVTKFHLRSEKLLTNLPSPQFWFNSYRILSSYPWFRSYIRFKELGNQPWDKRISFHVKNEKNTN